jgi:CelD/BcsL family acetyltransferase involved in cellulose biosynthesis
MNGLMRTCAQQGWLRLGIAYLDGVPAAAQLWVVVAGTASIYKMAYDERFAKESVGTVLSSLLMEYVIDVDKVKTVDYLSGDDAYKRDWMSHRRERWGIMAFNLHTTHGVLAAARHVGGRAAKRALGAFRRLYASKA